MAHTILLNFLVAALVFILISRKLFSFIKARYGGQGVKYKANVIFCGIIAVSVVPVVFLTFNEFLMLTAVVLIAYFFRKKLLAFSQKALSKKNGKIMFAAVALACGLTGCQADTDTGQVDTEQTTIQETQQTTETTGQTEQTVENAETSETETFSESLDNVAETVIIAGHEYDINETDIFLWEMPVTDDDLRALSSFKELKNLSIDLLADGCEITDLSMLSKLGSLETLCVNGTYEDFRFLDGMTELTSLSLMHFNCTTLKNIPSDTIITEINIDESKISSLDWIVNFLNLKKISFNHFDNIDVTPIGNLKNLESFSLTFSAANEIDFSFLQNLKKLKSFAFDPFPSDNIYDLSALSKCIDLEYLSISGAYKSLQFCESLKNLKSFSIISDGDSIYDILPLVECTNLQEIKLYCNFDKAQYNRLENTLVDCIIIKEDK